MSNVPRVSIGQFMTVAEFADRMDMAEHKVRRRIRTGDIRAVNISHPNKPEYRISEEELARWLAEKAVRVA